MATAAERNTSLPPSLPPTKDDLRVARGDPEDDIWIEGDHPTHNPDGVTNSNHDYWPKTQEEKAERLLVEMVDILDVPYDRPYPEGSPWESREDLLKRIHSPQELVEADDFAEQHEKNLAAGGSVSMEDVFEGNADADTRSPAKDRTRGNKGKAR